jgi:hypothetical protein
MSTPSSAVARTTLLSSKVSEKHAGVFGFLFDIIFTQEVLILAHGVFSLFSYIQLGA